MKQSEESCEGKKSSLAPLSHFQCWLTQQLHSYRPDLAENYLRLEVQLALKKFKKSQCEDLLKATCALLNSGGGVLEMKISDYSQLEKGTFWPKLDKFWQTFENSLEPVLEPLCYPDLIDRVVKEDVVFLFIKAADCLISIGCKLYVAGDARVHRASFTKTLELLEDRPECKIPLEELPPLPETFASEQVLDFHETKKEQFKNYTPEKKTTQMKLLNKKDEIKKQISAFANVLGGIILFGISNNGIVDGLKIDSDEQSVEEVEQQIESIIGEMKWCYTPQKLVHWNVNF
ncbi:hypothetical protein pdam_00000207 [Pocillopora damicornis]|uniref:Schlafen AlbA-2 domain-containing protein n=1 Tax=Pocillopora damicornis TaxID=46731 RepID=A0A3M6UWR7_POCDA|nr:hypothetical protein pdam_00000207 [Pocillopora damicornis]